MNNSLRRNVVALCLAGALIGSSSACSDSGSITRRPSATTPSDDRTTTTPDDTQAVSDATPGAASLDDPITPDAGNGGYDVSRYDLDITVADDRATISGEVTITATATQSLSTFNLDFTGLTVDTVIVDDEPATSTAGDTELVVTPKRPIGTGDEFTTVVTYSGEPQPVSDPSAPGTIGWLSADSGTFIAAEPTGAKGFFPCNDHPSDKAIFNIEVTASNDDTVIANGTLTSKEEADTDGFTTWEFDQTDPMATYLVQIAVGDYELIESEGPGGLPIRHAVVSSITDDERALLDETSAQIEFFEPLFGTFPLDTYGLLVADSLPEFALETQTLTLLPAEWLEYGPESTSAVMAHELAHQWFGDSVSPERWSDIWLNEGFATYAEWLWEDHKGFSPLDESVSLAMSQADRWRTAFGAVADPAPEFLFSPNVYDGAGIVLHALRLTVGDDIFFPLLREWAESNAGTSATTDDFEALAGQLSGQDLTGFFDAWVRSTTLPPLPS